MKWSERSGFPFCLLRMRAQRTAQRHVSHVSRDLTTIFPLEGGSRLCENSRGGQAFCYCARVLDY